MSKGWSLSICLIATLSTSGLAWGQAGNTFHEEPEKPFLQPYSPAENYQSLDASHKTINNNAAKHKNVGKTPNKVLVTSPKKTPKSHQGRQEKSEVQRASPERGTAGSSSSFQGPSHFSRTGSGSFLDGYLLKSLNEKTIARKKAADDNASDENLPKKKLKKKKDSFIK